ncbi:MAG: preprotein translocase subunit SecA, partial [Clostridia bacterium]|nr:preprotein translocase subunit SecA [Clostridia bacterium]
TNNEFGFDYLRDNMAIERDELTQRAMNYAIVDEVDSILIDEARTPLIISGQADKPTDIYYRVAKVMPRLREEEDYSIDEKANVATLTENGVSRVEKILGVDNLYDDSNIELSHHVNQALRAHALMKRDRDYVVKDGQVVIVDEFTGRMMFGRRFSEGLHQAIEAKEGVKIERESQTLASITFQNYFRMYKKLAGMTGTAKTEEQEFREIYGLDVVVIPTNKPMIRKDNPDIIYRTEEGKFKAVVEEIVERHSRGQPVLVGTISIEKSEILSRMLKRRGIPHEVLNAKYHDKEAEIISKAGQKGAVTIATNMAGRGTDIVLGEGVAELGGLHVLGTERHESRRIDNQLRGRSGRQGDAGSSRFYVTLEDDLMRVFGADNITGILDKVGMDDDTPIEHSMISRSIENAQKRVESRNFDIRKHVLEYDDVLNQQREIIYSQRKQVLDGEDIKENILDMMESTVDNAIEIHGSHSPYPEEWDLEGLLDYAGQLFLPEHDLHPDDLLNMTKEEIRDTLLRNAVGYYEQREQELGSDLMRQLERVITLKIVDQKWMGHLDAMDQLRQGIGLRAYGQQDPLIAYRKESYDMFNDMTAGIQEDIVRYVLRVNVVQEQQKPRVTVETTSASQDEEKKIMPARSKKIGRNEPCPCGSGKKYKRCCGKSA